MKLMKHIIIALVLCAIPAMAFAQAGTSVACAACTHDVPVYMGEGGFIATAPMGTEMVTYVSTCGGVTRSGEIMPDADMVVAMLFNMENGLACDMEGGHLQLGPVMDGGWFWLTDDMNSAVGGLVSHDIQMLAGENGPLMKAMIADAGPGVTMTEDMRGAVMLKETSTGRVGILPTILPMPPTPPLRKCGYAPQGNGFVAVSMSCALGDGGSMLVAHGPVDPASGNRQVLMSGSSVARPRAAGASYEVGITLWANGSGHYDLTTPLNGHLSAGTTPFSAQMEARGPAGPGEAPRVLTDSPNAAAENIAFFYDPGSNVGLLTLGDSTAYCGTATAPLNHSYPVTIVAGPDASVTDVVPPVARITTNPVTFPATMVLNVVCPGAASPAPGTELVPENPFPTE